MWVAKSERPAKHADKDDYVESLLFFSSCKQTAFATVSPYFVKTQSGHCISRHLISFLTVNAPLEYVDNLIKCCVMNSSSSPTCKTIRKTSFLCKFELLFLIKHGFVA